MAIRHHLDYGTAGRGGCGANNGRRGLLLLFRRPVLLFLSALGLFLGTTQLGSMRRHTSAVDGAGVGGVLQQPASAASSVQLLAQPEAAPSQEQAELERRLAKLEQERDALKGDVSRLRAEEKAQSERAAGLKEERDALAEQVKGFEEAIREEQHWAKRSPLLFEQQPALKMPAWTLDHRFYALGAVLTRDQVDAPQLYLDLILMGRKTFDKTGSSVLGVEGLDGEWAMGEAFNRQDPNEIVKAGGKFLCRLKAGKDPIPATLVPVHTTLDPNVNAIVEIVRCPVPDGGKTGTVDAVFLLQDAPVTPDAETAPYDLVRVSVSRETRTAGYFNYKKDASKLDPWKTTPDKLHLCVPGVTWSIKCPVLDLVLEFAEYHTQNGVDHIHFAMDFPYDSDDMRIAMGALRPYIEEGKVSVLSTQTVHGPGWIGSDHPKLWHINSCLAYTKGLAEWVGVWDLDEFLVPRAKDKSIIQTIEDLVKEDGRQGPQDTCYLRFTSYNHVGDTYNQNRTWVGQMFAQGRETVSDQTWQKCVVSARNVYFSGFHLPGACRREGMDWEKQLSWDEAIHVNETVAAMHHYRNKFVHAGDIATNVTTTDEYARDRFPAVLEKLKERKTDEAVAKWCDYTPEMNV